MRQPGGRVPGTDTGVLAPPGQSPSRGLGFPVGHLPASLSAAGTSSEAGGCGGGRSRAVCSSSDCTKPTSWRSPAPLSTRTRASSENAHGNDGVSLGSGFTPKAEAGCEGSRRHSRQTTRKAQPGSRPRRGGLHCARAPLQPGTAGRGRAPRADGGPARRTLRRPWNRGLREQRSWARGANACRRCPPAQGGHWAGLEGQEVQETPEKNEASETIHRVGPSCHRRSAVSTSVHLVTLVPLSRGEPCDQADAVRARVYSVPSTLGFTGHQLLSRNEAYEKVNTRPTCWQPQTRGRSLQTGVIEAMVVLMSSPPE